VYPGEHSSPDK